MSTFEELSSEVKQKIQGTIQAVEMLQKFFNDFKSQNDNKSTDKKVSEALKGNLSGFNFTGQYTDLSYFSQSEKMPLSAIKNISDSKIKEAVLDTFDKAAEKGLIIVDGDNVKITYLGKAEINKPDFIKAAQTDQIAAYNSTVNKMLTANLQANEVQMCVGLSGDYMNDFTFFNHSDKLDLSTVINHPDKDLSSKILNNVKQWQKCGAVTVQDGVANITDMGKKMLQMPQFKAATKPLTEKALATVGGMPGKVIITTKKIINTAVQTIQSANTTIKR